MHLKQIRLTKGLWALVSPEDFDYLNQWNWCASHESRGTKWYAIRFENKKKIRMHRAVIEHHTGLPIADKLVVDHNNHNSLDNRRENLDVCTQAENMKRSTTWQWNKKRLAKVARENKL